MTRQEYIEAVKVKIEEISPFDEPEHFIGEDDDSANTVKPIKEYIIRSLDEAAHNCLLGLPLSLLHADVEKLTSLLTPDEKYAEGDIEDGKVRTYIDEKGVGRLNVWQSIRLVRYHHSALQRDITAFITTEDPLYLIQQNKFTRAGQCKPVGVWSAAERQMEIYSFPKELYDTRDDNASLYAINLNKHVENQSTKPYINITNSEDRYYPFDKPTDEYNGTSFGRKVSNVWYRGWRTEDGKEVYTLGNMMPAVGADVYVYDGSSMTLHTPRPYITEDSDKYYAASSEDVGYSFNGTTYGNTFSNTWYRAWIPEGGGSGASVLYTEGDDIAVGDNAYVYRGQIDNAGTVDSYEPLKVVESSVEGVTDPSYVKSPIEYFIILECAAMVLDILGRHDAAANFRNEIQLKVQSILK